MKQVLFLLLLFVFVSVNAQTEEERVTATMKEFHQALVQKDIASINQQTEKALTYGHSNGWIQSKNDIIKDFETGYISYQSFKEDSIQVTISGNLANVRFTSDIGATVNGNSNTVHLKILEVWVKKGKRWILFARQAVR